MLGWLRYGSPSAVSVLLRHCGFHTTGAAASASAVPKAADAVIIGSGVVGCGIALELSRKGWSTVNIDRNAAAGLGSTSYSSGIIRTHYSVRHSVAVAYEGFLVWKNWQDYVGIKDTDDMAMMRQYGAVNLCCPGSKVFDERTTACHKELGVPYEIWDAHKLQSTFPYFNLASYYPPQRADSDAFGTESGRIESAVHFPLAGYVSDPNQATRNIQTAAQAAGAGFMNKTNFERVTYDGGKVSGIVVSTADGEHHISTPVVVNAAGPHSREVTQRIFSASDVPAANDQKVMNRPVRVEVAHINCPPSIDFGTNGMVITDLDAGMYFRPEVGNKIVVGSTEPECDFPHEIYPERADDVDTNLTDAWTNYVYRLALRVPEVELPASNATMGVVSMYDKADDWSPIYDKTAVPGLYFAKGTSGNQFKNCGVVGKVVATIIEEVQNGHDHDEEPLQMHLPLSGNTVSLGPFSRLRSTLSTSGSVLG